MLAIYEHSLEVVFEQLLNQERIDLGFSDEFLKSFQEDLQPGKVALLVIVEDQWAVKASEALADNEGMIFQQTLTDEMVQQLMEADEGESD